MLRAKCLLTRHRQRLNLNHSRLKSKLPNSLMRSHQTSSHPSHLHNKRRDHSYHHFLELRISECQLLSRLMARHEKRWMSRIKSTRTIMPIKALIRSLTPRTKRKMTSLIAQMTLRCAESTVSRPILEKRKMLAIKGQLVITTMVIRPLMSHTMLSLRESSSRNKHSQQHCRWELVV